MNKDSDLNPNTESINDEMLDEYDFSQAVRRNSHQSLSPPSIKIETREGDREVTLKTIEVTAIVNQEGKVIIQLPPSISPGEHRITLLIQEATTHQT